MSNSIGLEFLQDVYSESESVFHKLVKYNDSIPITKWRKVLEAKHY